MKKSFIFVQDMTQTNKLIIIIVLIGISIYSVIKAYNKVDVTEPNNYQHQLDSLNSVINDQDIAIEFFRKELDSLENVKNDVRYIQGKKIIEYKAMETPLRIRQLASRL